MSKIAITSDCNAGLDYIGYDSQIPVLRSMINFGDEHYIDGTDIKADEFYDKLILTNVIPSTSAPTLGEAIDMIENLIKEGYTDVIHFPISFELSGTGKTVLNLKEQYKDQINIHVFDTKTACYLQAYLALEAKRMVLEGKTVSEILERSEKLRKKSNAYFVVDNLMYLVKNGRLSGMSGTLGTIFKIKPLLNLNQEGKIVACKKIRTHKEAVKVATEMIKEELKNSKKYKIFVFHTRRIEDGKLIQDQLRNMFKDNLGDIELYTVTPAVGAHIGCGILGFGYFDLDGIDD